jgi:hypothetical protein
MMSISPLAGHAPYTESCGIIPMKLRVIRYISHCGHVVWRLTDRWPEPIPDRQLGCHLYATVFDGLLALRGEPG